MHDYSYQDAMREEGRKEDKKERESQRCWEKMAMREEVCLLSTNPKKPPDPETSELKAWED